VGKTSRNTKATAAQPKSSQPKSVWRGPPGFAASLRRLRQRHKEFAPERKRVSARVDEICGKAAERAIVTVASLIAEAEEARELAMRLGQPSAAVAALTAKAKLAGLWVEKTDNRNRNVDLDKMTDDELEQQIAELRASDPSELN
jgi:hypothetical protein